MSYNPNSVVAPADTILSSPFPVAGWYDVTWFGAKGDGTTDDTAAQQLALNTAPAGSVVFWPKTSAYFKTTAALNVTKAVTIVGSGSIGQATAATALFNITSDNVIVDGSDGLTLLGKAQAWPATDVPGEIAILATGTFNTGLAPTNISNITIRNVTIQDWGNYSILTQYIDGLEIVGNKITNATQAGVELISCLHFKISENTITNITGNGTAGSECYGISLSRFTGDSGNLTSQPVSSDGIVANNIINGVPTWNGIDTHSGERIAFSGNNVYNALRAYNIGASKNSAGTYTYPPLDISITGGALDSSLATGAATEGISFTGASGTSTPATGSISGVTIRNYGNEATSTSGAIVLSNTKGVAVTGCAIIEPGDCGITANTNNQGMSITGNSIIDPWSNTNPVVGIRTTGDNNDGMIAGNVIRPSTKSATYTLLAASGEGIRFSAGTANFTLISGNRIVATFPIADANATVIGLQAVNATTPVVISNTNVNANSIIILQPVPGQVGKGAFVSDITAGTSFSINSVAGDSSTYTWQIQQ